MSEKTDFNENGLCAILIFFDTACLSFFFFFFCFFALTISSPIPRLSRDITPELFYCSTYISSAFIRIGISITTATLLPLLCPIHYNDYYLIAYKNKSLRS